jgi:O-antigen/teichoic acid export membrane protein
VYRRKTGSAIHPMSAASQLFRNSALSFSTNVVTKAVNTIAFILIARMSQVDQAGIFSLGTTYLVIFTATAWGLDELMVRQVARNRQDAGQYFGPFLSLRVLISLTAYALMYILIRYVMGYSESTSFPILILGISLIPDSLNSVGQALLAAHERFEIPLIAGGVSSIIKLSGATLALFYGNGLPQIGWAWVAGSCVGAVITLGAAARQAGKLHLSMWLNRLFWATNLRLAVPFITIGFFLTLEYQTDVIILSKVRGEAEVGWYGAVTTIVFALTMIGQSYRAAVYPLMVRYHKSDPGKLGHLYDLSMFYLGSLALPMAAGLTLLSRPIILTVYNNGFSNAILPLQIIAWYLVFNYLNIPNSRIMLVSEQQKRLTYFLIASMGLNIILNLTLDAPLGAVGASIARVSSSLVFLLMNYYYVNHHIHSHHLSQSLKTTLFATLVMSGIVWALRSFNLWIAILVGLLVFIGVLIALRGVTDEEKHWINTFLDKMPLRSKI